MRMTTSAKNQRQDVGKRVQTLSQGIHIDVEYRGDSTESLYVIMLSSHVFYDLLSWPSHIQCQISGDSAKCHRQDAIF